MGPTRDGARRRGTDVGAGPTSAFGPADTAERRTGTRAEHKAETEPLRDVVVGARSRTTDVEHQFVLGLFNHSDQFKSI
jgi:hypothetical protein